MATVRSKDGSSIEYDRVGEGDALILITGALGLGSHHTEIAELLAADYTVITYDRRARGNSTEVLPYAVEREIEDIEALINAVGGKAALCGFSSGAALALEAANHLPRQITKLVLFEPPFITDNTRPSAPPDYVEHLQALRAQDKRGEAVLYFMTAALHIPEEYLQGMQSAPSWEAMKSVAHTLEYDGIIMGDRMSGKPLPTDRWTDATMPTLVLAGSVSEPFFTTTGNLLADLLPNATFQSLEGQGHDVSSAAIAPVLKEFLQ